MIKHGLEKTLLETSPIIRESFWMSPTPRKRSKSSHGFRKFVKNARNEPFGFRLSALICLIFSFFLLSASSFADPLDAITGASYDPPLPNGSDERTLEEAYNWLDSFWQMSLATVTPEKAPHISGVFYMRSGHSLYFLADRESNKIQNIKQQPEVAFTVWDHVSDVGKIKAVQGLGTARILEKEKRLKYGSLLMKAPGSVGSLYDDLDDVEWVPERLDVVEIKMKLIKWINNRNTRGPSGHTIRIADE